MPSATETDTDVYVLGTGVVGYRQLTREAEAALERSEQVFLLHTHDIVYEYLADEFDAAVTDLREEYEAHTDRRDTYERMAERVLSAASSATSPVSFVLYGHPMVYVSPSQIVLERADDHELTVEVRPGVSAMDCLYVDLGLDPAENGIQMYDATDLILREYELNPSVPTMIWQIGSIETTLYTTSQSSPQRFTRLREYLEQYYPEDHTVSLVKTATLPVADPEKLDYELGNLEQIHEDVTPLHTLYIPPSTSRNVQDAELRNQVTSRKHLKDITTSE